jgi:hypothetical protein
VGVETEDSKNATVEIPIFADHPQEVLSTKSGGRAAE